MKRSEAEAAMREERPVIRLRSNRAGWAQPVLITGIGYRNGYRNEPVPGGNGVRVAHLDDGGLPTGYVKVYPLGQLHDTSIDEWRAEQARRNEVQQRANRERRQEDEARRARAERAVLGLGTGVVSTIGWSSAPYVVLTVEQAEALAESRAL